MLTVNQTIAADVALVNAIPDVPEILRIVCEITGMNFAVIARVSECNWTACAVLDRLGMGIGSGHELDIGTTFCREVLESRTAIMIDSVKDDLRYRDHLTPKIYGFESYVSVPIVLSDGHYFGSLCALDRRAIKVTDRRIRFMFLCFAGWLAEQLHGAVAPSLACGRPSTRDQVANLRSLIIAFLTDEESCAGASAEHSAVAQLWDRLALPFEHDSPLIADALTLARSPICAGRLLALQRCTDLPLRLRSVVATLRFTHPERQIISNIVFAGPVDCDPDWIERLASSMLGSALRRGGSSSAVSFIAKVKQNFLLLSAWNHGDTISPHEIADLFRPDWRSMDDASSAGAAMHLCAEVVRSHRGTIVATSSPNDGTQLLVRLPRASRVA